MRIVEQRISTDIIQAEKCQGALWEISFVLICLLIAEWAILPFFGRNMLVGAIPVGLAFALMFFSHYARGETAPELGWRVDNLPQAMCLLIPPMLLTGALLIAVGWVGGSLNLGRSRAGVSFLWTLMWLFIWGLIQQYGLQAFINRRAQIIWGKGYRSILVVASIFGLLHLPNLWLALATFAGGLLWATVYQRVPNLYALAFSHSLMTVVLVSTLPASALHGLRVGFNYFR